MSKCSEGNLGLVHNGFKLVIDCRPCHILRAWPYIQYKTDWIPRVLLHRLYEAVGLGWVYGFTKYDLHVCPAIFRVTAGLRFCCNIFGNCPAVAPALPLFNVAVEKLVQTKHLHTATRCIIVAGMSRCARQPMLCTGIFPALKVPSSMDYRTFAVCVMHGIANRGRLCCKASTLNVFADVAASGPGSGYS